MSSEHEDIVSSSQKKDSHFVRKVKGVIVGATSLISSFSGLAQNQPNKIVSQNEEPVAQETTYTAPERNNENNTYALQGLNNDADNLVDRRTNANTSSNGEFRIGNVNSSQVSMISIPEDININAQADFREGLIRNTYELSTKDEYNNLMAERNNSFAYCSGGIYDLPKYKISGEFEHLVDSLLTNEDARSKLTPYLLTQLEYMKGNPIAEMLVKTHEVDIHGHHEEQGIFNNSSFSPYMSVVASDMTERLASFGEYVALAQVYNTLKNVGMETLNIDGRNISVESILDYNEGLRETIEQFGSDTNNPKLIKEIAKISNKKWTEYRESKYGNQAINHLNSASDNSLIGMIIQARNWEKTQTAMFHGIKIGNQDLNIPRDCFQYFMPSEERISAILGDDYLTNENLLSIDKYLDSIGLKKDEDKALYLAEQSFKINNRDSSADLNLRNLFLACGRDNAGTILYSDGIIDTISNDGNVVTSDILGNASFNSSLQQLDEATNNPKNAQELKNILSQLVVKTEQLSPEQILANDLANVSVKTEKVNTVQMNIMQFSQMDR